MNRAGDSAAKLLSKDEARRIAVNIAKLWRNDATAYPFDSNNVVAITRVLFRSRHAWFCPHQYRYCVGGCSGAVLGMSVAHSEIISGAPEIRSRLQHHRQRPD